MRSSVKAALSAGGCASWLWIVGIGLVSVGGCGDEDVVREGDAIATLTPVRGEGALVRIAAAEKSERPGLWQLHLDAGPRGLIRDAVFTLTEDDELELERGQGFFDVRRGDALTLVLGETRLLVRDAAISVEDGRVHVARGDVGFQRGEARGRVRAGEHLALASGVVAADVLWEDWTGGLARTGPGVDQGSAVGTLTGRVPDEIGQARWPLVVRRMDVRVRVIDDLAITEVEQEYFNPASEALEGLYQLRVPEGAVLQRFAVDRDGRLVDGYVREKRQAEAAYEAQVYRGSTLDPALLEWKAPGEYQARIYPIAPGATRRIAVRWTSWLERGAPDGPALYRLPLAGEGEGPRIQELAFEAELERARISQVRAGLGAEVDGTKVRVRRSDFVPRADLVLELTRASEEGLPAWRAAHVAPPRDPRRGAMIDEDELDYLYVPLRLPDALFGEVSPGLDLAIVVDVSAGTDASSLELGRSVVESLAAHLGPEDRVAVLASDVALRPLADDTLGPATHERLEAALDALAREPAGGATDLGAVLAAAAAKLDPARHGVVVYVGDAVPTVGELGADALLSQLARLPHPVRAYGIALGGEGDLDLLDAITRGGGLALRVEGRAAAAEAALELLGHARLPAAQRVTVTLEGAEQVFPRSAVDVVRGAVLPVVARLEGATPGELVVRGTIGGREIEERVALREMRIEDDGDLRLRWAGERLRQLLRSGGQREEIADLGVRYGLITPFTSFYVPSAAELAALGPAARELYRDVRGLGRARGASLPALAPTLAFLGTAGCQGGADLGGAPATEEAPSQSALARSEPADQAAMGGARSQASTPDAVEQAAPGEAFAADMPSAAPMGPAAAEPTAEPMADSMPPAPRRSARAADAQERSRARPTTTAIDEAEAVEDEATLDRAMMRGTGTGQGYGYGGLGLSGTGSGGGGSAGRAARDAREAAETSGAIGLIGANRADGDGRFRAGGAVGSAPESMVSALSIELRLNVRDPSAHRARRCSDAADLLLDGRRELWRERLGRESAPSSWARLFREAEQACELPAWRDRQAFLDVVLTRAGNVSRMIDAWRAFGGGASDYLRRGILRRVRTPEDLRLVRSAFGVDGRDPALVERVLAAAGDGEGRVRALRRLVAQMPHRVDLKKALLEELERQGKLPEAKRLATDLRSDPLTDAGIRTAIGEMYLRLDDEAEARRVFGEIVEFSPEDAFARRRLGDLYRAYGWHEDAYRQYVTLAALTPDDPTVSLLLAQAAAGAGRIDEALRLEQSVLATSDPSGAAGLGRVALLWSSLRFAELRQGAREAGDQETLAALEQRMRRSGVLREASGLRATLVWSHPDAGIALWAGHPRLGLTRPPDLAPELGLEAFDVQEPEAGRYQLEVRRVGDYRTAVSAKLVVVWDEGGEGERVEIVELRFEPGRDQKRAFHIEGRVLTEVTR